MSNYDLTITTVQGVGPGGGKFLQATMGDGLFQMVSERRDIGVIAGLLGALPLLDVPALPADAFCLDQFSSGCAVGADYGDLSVDDPSASRSVLLCDPGYTDGDPCPNFKRWCQDLGGTYSET